MCKTACPYRARGATIQSRGPLSMACCDRPRAVWSARPVRPPLYPLRFPTSVWCVLRPCRPCDKTARNADLRAAFRGPTSCGPPTSAQRAQTPCRDQTMCRGSWPKTANTLLSPLARRYDRWKNAPFQNSLSDIQPQPLSQQSLSPQFQQADRCRCHAHRAYGTTGLSE